jgi:radical SAM protein with 4Fe4S-binding SPASM domain
MTAVPGSNSAWGLLTRAAIEARSLLSLQVELTSKCLFRCAHCYNDRTVPDRLSASSVTATLEEARDLGCLVVSLSGGEIYLHPELHDVVRAARRMQFCVCMMTSGWHIDAEEAAFLADQAVFRVSVSVYSADPEVHDRVTGMPGSQERAVRAVRLLRSRNVDVVLSCVTMQLNADGYKSVVALANDLGCPCKIDPVIVPMESGDCSPCGLRPSTEFLRDLVGEYRWAETERAYRALLASQYDRKNGSACLAGITAVALASDGTVTPCVDLNVPCGNVLTTSFKEIWLHSPELARFRELRWTDLRVCSDCSLRNYCHHCIAQAHNEHGDLLGPATEDCRHAVVLRDLLRERGVIPATETELPPPLSEAPAK